MRRRAVTAPTSVRDIYDAALALADISSLDLLLDARSTDMMAAGMINIGQLVRERHGSDGVVPVGFGSHSGSVIAADQWGAPARRMEVQRPGTTASRPQCTEWRRIKTACSCSHPPRAAGGRLLAADVHGHRAIGVVYNPEGERRSNYVPTVLGRRYDAFIHCDRTTALRPLSEPAPTRWSRLVTAFPTRRRCRRGSVGRRS